MTVQKTLKVGVVGATGAVGRTMMSILEERKFPVQTLLPLASAKSAGKELSFRGKTVPVEALSAASFAGMDLALFSAGASISRQYAPAAVKAGCVVVDNSSAFRMEPDIPLVVPEINSAAIGANPGIIANPNCSTIQMVMVLKPIHDHYRVRRVVVSTYQSVSGSGQKAIDELTGQTVDLLADHQVTAEVYPHQIAFNCLPHIDAFLENGYTKEEMKLVNETHKILGDDSLQISPTTVRVPVLYSHSEAVYVEYPLAVDAAGQDEVFVGRIRRDLSNSHAVQFWVVADNLRKGAALNAVQIAERVFGC
ncbi:MAG: aspartate-semialdehyde dehydrogenase [Nitrospinaceae bacterium]